MTVERIVTVTREDGLHARPAREVVDAATEYDANVVVSANGRDARATSPLELTALGVEPGTDVEVRAEGEDANAALTAITAVLGATGAEHVTEGDE